MQLLILGQCILHFLTLGEELFACFPFVFFFNLCFWWLEIDSQPAQAHEWGYWESRAVQASSCHAVPADLSVAFIITCAQE